MSAVPEPLEELRLVGVTPLHETHGTRVALSNGEAFWVQGEMVKVLAALDRHYPNKPFYFVYVGNRIVNPVQVAQLTYGPIPSTEPFERLGDD